MKHKHFNRLLSMLLAMAALFSLLIVPANAATLYDSTSVTLTTSGRGEFLSKSTGGTLGGGYWNYTSSAGLTGAAYCVNWGLSGISPNKALTLQEYNRYPETMGAFANGYPQRTLEQFKQIHADEVRGIANLTEDEYRYATQVAVWASCGQISVPGTSFTAGRAAVVEPTADAQQIRIFDSVKAILVHAAGWTKHLYNGLYLRAEENRDVRGVDVTHLTGLAGAAAEGTDGIKKETINGKEYYTRVMYVASATSTWIDGYTTKVYSTDAPQGTIFTAENGAPLETVQENGATCYKVNTSHLRVTNLNANGEEYYGAFKVCIPADNVADEGSFTIKAVGGVAQYNLFLANNPSATEQSYIISDPGYTTCGTQADFRWSGTHNDDLASLQVVKAGAGGAPLEGAEFTLTGSGGTTVSGTSDRNGQVMWTGLPAGETYTLTETSAPDGYTVVEPMNITLTAGRTAYVTVTDTTEKTFKVKKIDAQNKSSLQGAVFRFEQIDGSYVTTGTTGFDGTIFFQGDEQLPYGAYRVTEQSAPEGYQKDTRVETVEWDGTRDVTVTFENVRDIGLTIVKVDGQTGVSLPGATFDVYADGELITSVTTNDAGEAYVTGIRKEAYIEIVETAAPAGYVLDQTPHGIHIDPYDPALEDDPVLTVTNQCKAALRIVKMDQQSGDRLPGVTFEIYKDAALFDTQTTDGNGEIFLYDLEPGTYLVQEVSTDDVHVVTSTPQQIKLEAGQTGTQTLVFFNSLKPGIHLVKVDSVTMKSLPNVRFEFKMVGGSYRQEFTTDINGEIDLSKLEPGAYEVRELEAPDGYLIDDAVRVVQINPDEDANFVFTNTPKPSLRLIKTSSDGSRLGGVHFRIAKIEDGTHYLDRITDDNGEINISDLEPGVYSVQETATVSDHILDIREYHVELFPGQTSTLTIENQKRPNLTIRKTDKDTGDPIPGVTFTLRGADGPTITTEPTGADGTVHITNLLPGTYTITEQNVPENYILDTTPQTVTLFANREAQVEFQNYQRSTLKITKVDINGRFLTGAIFEVKTKAGVKIGDFPVGADGAVTISNVHLDEGYYIVTEKQAPTGYILDPTPHEVYLRPGKTTEISIENEKKPGLTIYKVDSVVGDGLKGARFEIWVSKDKNQNGTYQQLTSSYYYTDENGIIHLDNLDTGWYKIVEAEPPAGYMLKDPSEQIIYVEHDKAVTVTFENIPKSALVIRKIDSDTGVPLSNAWFRVRYLGGASGSGGTIIGEFSTSSNGNIVITGLDAGTYVCEEINAPNGYVMDTAPQTAYISGKEQDCIILTFTNSKYGALLIKKVDSATGAPLSDVQFFVTDSDGSVIGSSNGYFTTDSAGTILISDIEPGTTLVVKETRTCPGYVLDETPQTIKIESNTTKTLEFRNQPTGSLLIRKVCSVNPSVTLANAEFKVAYSDGSLIGDNNGVYRSDENGEVRIEGLTPGKSVVITETKAPAGFLIDTQSQTAVIQAGKTVSVTMKNQPKGGIIVQKRDSITGLPLSGAEFRVTTAAGCEVGLDGVIGSSTLTQNGIFTTDANGEIRISNLAPGTYVLTEIKAPDGYVMDAPSTNVVIGQGGDTQTVVVTNSKAGTLVIDKRDSLTGKPLEGVTFKVTTSTGEFVPAENGQISSNGLYFTDKDGKITINGVVGTLVVTETATIPGYTIDEATRTQTVVVSPNDTQTLHFTNTPSTTLVIEKYIEGTTTPLKGITFLVTDSSGTVVGNSNGEFITDENGRIVLNDLTPGTTVTAREVKTLEGYVLDTTPKSILIKTGEVQVLRFYNQKQGTIVIRKLDKQTGEPLAGVDFQITYSDGSYLDDDYGHLSSKGLYKTDANEEIRISGVVGTLVITETKPLPGYVMDEGTKTQTVKVNSGDTQTITVYNTKVGGLTIIKKDEETGERIKGVQFEVRKMNGEIIGTYTTDTNGVINLPEAEKGWYQVVELKAAKGYKLDDTPHQIEVKDGSTATLEITNRQAGSALIHKIDSVTGKGIYGVKFLLSDARGNPIGTYESDNEGYVYIDKELDDGRYTIREIECAEGYILDTQPKTVYVEYGGCTTITWKNTAVTGQIQVTKTSADYNSMNGWPAGTPIPGTEFEIYNYRTGNLVDTIRTDKNGIAVSNPLPLGRYKVVESKAADFYSLDKTPIEVEIEYAGQIVKTAMTNKSLYTNVSIKKTGYTEVMPGQQIRYDFSGIANNSTTALTSFYWRDTLPVQAVRLDKIVTGTYNVQGNYKIVFKTNLNGEYRTMYDNLSTMQNYVLDASPAALGLASNEYVTEFMVSFGVVPANFRQVDAPKVYCSVVSWLTGGTQFVNQADVGGVYDGQWIMAASRWVTQVYKPSVPLPRTGY